MRLENKKLSTVNKENLRLLSAQVRILYDNEKREIDMTSFSFLLIYSVDP